MVTSRVPVAEGCIPQHPLGSLSAQPSTWLVQQAAPDLAAADAAALVRLCRGVPLLLRLAADAFASGRMSSVQVRGDGGGG